MRIGVLGAGNVGRTLAASLAAAGHEVTFGVRDPSSTKAATAAAAVSAARIATLAEAAAGAEVIVLAVPFRAAAATLDAAGDLGDAVVIDATNDVQFPSSDNEQKPRSAAERLAPLTGAARLVKSFNTVGWEQMADPGFGDQRADMYLCGDDPAARDIVAGLVADVGFDPVDCGPLANARLLESLATLWIWQAANGGRGRSVAFKLLSKP